MLTLLKRAQTAWTTRADLKKLDGDESVLKRAPLHPNLRRVVEAANEELKFMEGCSKKLGYDVMLTLDGVFKALGIDPFTSTSVDAYMWNEAKRYTHAHYRPNPYNQTLGAERILDGARMNLSFANLIKEFRMNGWKAVPLSEYKDFVPEQALRWALEIAELLPEAAFSVVYFKPEDVTAMVIDDPFLRLDYKGCEIHFDVWDEPGFTAKLLQPTT